MKKIYITLLCAAFAAAACNDDFLDREPLDVVSNARFWRTQEQLQLAVNGCYDFIKGRGTVDMEHLSDNTLWPFALDYRSIASGNFTSELNSINTEWATDYDGIRRCNEFLANYERVQMDAATAARYAAEVRFIRVYLYSYLTQFFGDVQLVTTPLNADDPEVYGSRQSKTNVVDFMLDELDSIYNQLPLSYATADFGRVTRGAALALKSRIALYNQRYEEAEQAAKAVMELGVYQLYSNGDPATSYNELFKYKGRASRNPANRETILARVHAVEISTHNLSREIWVPDEFIRWNPTKSLADAYLCSDGLPIDKSPSYSEDSYEDIFQHRDPRMKQTLLAPGTPWEGKDDGDADGDPNTVFNIPKFKADKKGAVTLTGFYFNKYVEPSTVGTGNSDENDVIIIRYAEVLLNYAEALLEQGKLTQAAIDNSINLLRRRVGMADMDMAMLAANGLDLREEVHRDRMVELALEGTRYFDILRWKQGPLLAQDIKGIPEAFVPSTENTGSFNTDAEGYIIVDAGRNFTDPKNYLWPVPLTQVQRNPALGNNPGW